MERDVIQEPVGEESVLPIGEYEQSAQAAFSAPVSGEPTAVVPRALFNSVIIAVVFFALGLLLGVIVMDRRAQENRDENRALINQAVQAAVAAAGGSADAARARQLDPAQRYAIDDGGSPSLGPADAPIVIIEFGDFRCGFCKRFNDETLTPLLERYGDRVRLVYRDYPILGQASLEAAIAAACANDQARFWEFHDLLFANQNNLTRAGYLSHAQTLGLDVAAFTTCLDEAPHTQAIVADYQAGEALGVTGTPTFFINGRPLIGAQPLQAFVNVIEEELAAAAAAGT